MVIDGDLPRRVIHQMAFHLRGIGQQMGGIPPISPSTTSPGSALNTPGFGHSYKILDFGFPRLHYYFLGRSNKKERCDVIA